ncbi:MAG TPA: hypothetical protein VFF73_05630 [Planctomycetota bacterium]|nr:hypothetical protein [Planctomycetota bacterium]
MRRLPAAALVCAVALAPLCAFSQEEDQPKQEPLRFRKIIQNDAQDDIIGIEFKGDTTYQISKDIAPAIAKKIKDLAATLEENAPVIVYTRKNAIVGLEKDSGANKQMGGPQGGKVQKAAMESKEGDEIAIVVVGGRTLEGKFKSADDTGIKFTQGIRDKNNVLVYADNGTAFFSYAQIKTFTNLTLQAKIQAEGNNPDLVANDPIGRLGLKEGDTIWTKFKSWQIVKLTPADVTLKEWKSPGWDAPQTIDRNSLTEVKIVPLEWRRSYPVGDRGEVVVVEQRQRDHKSGLSLTGKVFHDQADSILVGATLIFACGKPGADLSADASIKDRVELQPVFCGEERKEIRNCGDLDDGQVTLQFDPAKNLVAARSPAAKPYIVSALASTTRDVSTFPRIYAAAAANGDPQLAVLLAVRWDQTPEGPAQTAISDALIQFGEKGAAALIDHLAIQDGGYQIPVAHEDGTVGLSSQKDKATKWKKSELQLLTLIPGAASGDRGKGLFQIFEERQADLGADVTKVFIAHPSEAIDTLLDFSVRSAGHPTNDELKRGEDANSLIKALGEAGFAELLSRIRLLPGGPTRAKQLQVRKNSGESLAELVTAAIRNIVQAKRDEIHAVLVRRLEDAKAAEGKNWEEALSIVEEILKQESTYEDAQTLHYTCLVKVAEKRIQEKKRGEASQLLHRVVDDGQKGKGAEPLLAKITLEAIREDLGDPGNGVIGCCIRKNADECAEVVTRVKKEQSLKIAPVPSKDAVEGWHPVVIPSGNGKDFGWIWGASVRSAGDGASVTVLGDYPPAEEIRKLLEQVKKLVPDNGPLDAINAELWLRDADEKYDSGKYTAAAASYATARDLAPNDPRLSRAWKCWFLANQLLLLLFGAIIFIAAVSLTLVLRQRQKRVRVAEFKYYGKDRIRVEREIDGGSGQPVDGSAPPAPAPAAGAAGGEPPAAPPA